MSGDAGRRATFLDEMGLGPVWTARRAQPDSGPGSQAQGSHAPRAETREDAQTSLPHEAQASVKPSAQVDAQASAQADAQASAQPSAQAVPEPAVRSGLQVTAQAASQPDSPPESKQDSQPESQTELQSESQSVTQYAAQPESATPVDSAGDLFASTVAAGNPMPSTQGKSASGTRSPDARIRQPSGANRDLPSQRDESNGANRATAPDAPSAGEIAGMDWPELEAAVAGCVKCRLCETRNRTVFGVGDRNAQWMFIGEGPGRNEDLQGEPFVGPAGKLLDNMMLSMNLRRGENAFIANIVKCRPTDANGRDRAPEPDEAAACLPYLERQMALIGPGAIVALGKTAAVTLLDEAPSVTLASLRGTVRKRNGVPLVVTYHPAYLLRKLGDKSKSWRDLCLALDSLPDGD
jgi:uracil-DNA glycosylase family 4